MHLISALAWLLARLHHHHSSLENQSAALLHLSSTGIFVCLDPDLRPSLAFSHTHTLKTTPYFFASSARFSSVHSHPSCPIPLPNLLKSINSLRFPFLSPTNKQTRRSRIALLVGVVPGADDTRPRILPVFCLVGRLTILSLIQAARMHLFSTKERGITALRFSPLYDADSSF